MHICEETGPAGRGLAARCRGHGPPQADGRPAAHRVVPLATGESPWQPDDADDVPNGDPEPELPDPDDLEIDDPPSGDDAYWDVFIPDDDECDPLPEPGDFWVEDDRGSGVERLAKC